jgi:hypothetical protein
VWNLVADLVGNARPHSLYDPRPKNHHASDGKCANIEHMTLKWSANNRKLLDDTLEFEIRGNEVRVPIDSIKHISLESLAEVMTEAALSFIDSIEKDPAFSILSSLGTSDDISDTFAFDISIDGHLLVEIVLSGYVIENRDQVMKILNSLLAPKGDELIDLSWIEEDEWHYWLVRIRPSLTPAERLVDELIQLQKNCATATGSRIYRSSGGEPFEDVEDDFNLLISGYTDILMDRRESSQLEVKSHYNLDRVGDKVDLAQHVSSFANSEYGGLFVVGLRTQNPRNLGDVIKQLTPLEFDAGLPNRYGEIIDKRIYPPILGLRIELVPCGVRASIAILIPPQKEISKPFLVHGVMVDGKYQNSFFSINIRRNDQTMHISGSAIHEQLSAGRIALFGVQSDGERTTGNS